MVSTGNCSILVSWGNGNISIKLEHSFDNLTWTTILSVSTLGQTSFTDTGLPAGKTVYYRYTVLSGGPI